jgi:hypothetical protein
MTVKWELGTAPSDCWHTRRTPSNDELPFKPPSRIPQPWHAQQPQNLAGKESLFNWVSSFIFDAENALFERNGVGGPKYRAPPADLAASARRGITL